MAALGYRIAIHHSLTQPILLGGVPRRFAILNGTFCAAFVLGLQAIFTVPIFVVIHMIAVYLTKKDPYFFEVMLRHLRQKAFYRT